ncbi:MAG: YIP1 family protein [Myxococcota bacterium]
MKDHIEEPTSPSLFLLLREPRVAFRLLGTQSPSSVAFGLVAVWGIERNLRNKLKVRLEPTTVDVLWDIMGVLTNGIVFGLSMWFVSSWVCERVVRLLGHQATSSQIRNVMAWSSVPKLVSVVLLLGFYITIGDDFVSMDQRQLITKYPASILAVFLPWGGCSVWYTALLVIGLSEVTSMSIGKSIVAWLLTAVPIIILLILYLVIMVSALG